MTDARDSNPGTVVLPDTRVRGRFLWHELMTTDTRAAVDFYTNLVGWTLQSWDQNPSYQMFLAGGVPIAGLMTLPEEAKLMGAPPGWLGYIGCADADATASLAVKLGGRILKEAMQVPNVGRFVVLQDPYGAVFSAFTPEQEPVGEDRTGPGDFSWHELATLSVEGAFAYYHELFGWEKIDSMDMGPGLGAYVLFGAGGQTLGGIYKVPPGAKFPPAWLPYALVSSSQKAAAAIPKLGGTVINGPMEVPGNDEIVQLLDPQGGMFALHSKGTAKASAAGALKASASVAGETAAPKRARPAAAKVRRATTAKKRVKAAKKRVKVAKKGVKVAKRGAATAGRRRAATGARKKIARRRLKKGIARVRSRVKRATRKVVRKVRRSARRRG